MKELPPHIAGPSLGYANTFHTASQSHPDQHDQHIQLPRTINPYLASSSVPSQASSTASWDRSAIVWLRVLVKWIV